MHLRLSRSNSGSRAARSSVTKPAPRKVAAALQAGLPFAPQQAEGNQEGKGRRQRQTLIKRERPQPSPGAANRQQTGSKRERQQPQSSTLGKQRRATAACDRKHLAADTNAASENGQASKEAQQPTVWRVFNVAVPWQQDPGKDEYGSHQALAAALAQVCGCQEELNAAAVTVVRKTYDARKTKRRFTYVVDVLESALQQAGCRKLRHKAGSIERQAQVDTGCQPSSRVLQPVKSTPDAHQQLPVIIVGSGPAGLFAAWTLAQAGVKLLPIAPYGYVMQCLLLERGQPVEVRGRDIGALMVRRLLNPDSNLCYGEGGAGTWSDGKLTTRIGHNSSQVRSVLQLLHAMGAPQSILVDGKPHIGTDRLVRLLRNFRAGLQSLGVDIRFGCAVQGLMFDKGRRRVLGVQLADGCTVEGQAVVLAVGHSARNMYRHLAEQGVTMTPKPFAMGFRIEHPQELLNQIQYGREDAKVGKLVSDYDGNSCCFTVEHHPGKVARGRGRLPVADYSLATTVTPTPDASNMQQRLAGDWAQGHHWWGPEGDTEHAQGAARGVYSFCMCPGGQIVPTSTNPSELCINGMSFSRRHSQWANSALVVSVLPEDWEHLLPHYGPLAGVELQRLHEVQGAIRGGGQLRAPVQRVTDFLAGTTAQPGSQLPSSSYRLGVVSAPLHDLYSPSMTAALYQALTEFEAKLPGFICTEGLLHGVETRTSAPVRIDRDLQTCMSVSTDGLYPAGEGAGYAGGIVSAAVDGIKVAEAMLQHLGVTRQHKQAIDLVAST